MPDWLNLANLLTLLRLLLAPFVVPAIIHRRPILTLALFGVAAVTDVLDGWAARHLGMGTQVGAYFDPIADKLLLNSVYVALGIAGTIPVWLVVLVLGRDALILLSVALLMLFARARQFPPSVWGKLSTFIQITSVVVWTARGPLASPVADALAVAFIWACTAGTAWSGLHYFARGVQIVLHSRVTSSRR